MMPLHHVMVDNFKQDGINTEYIFHEEGISSGTALIMIGDGGHNYLSVAPGANYRLTPGYIDQCENLMAGRGNHYPSVRDPG